jgi:flagellar basal body rod protein FlgG
MPENDRKLGKSSDEPGRTPGPGDIPPPMMEMVKKMFDGMRISIAVDVVGTLVKTSSPHVAGQRVTILEMDMGELMKQADGMKNLQGLQPLGDNAWARTFASGDPVIGVPGDGNLGVLQAGALEESNIDLTGELVSMIATQRAYEVTSKAIKSSDEMMSQANQLVR